MQQKSFTLIEILVVIVIIGILSAFIIVSMVGVSSKATIAKGQAFSNSIKNSLMLNLVSEWRMDDASGTTAQDHWGANPGTWYGAGGGDYTSPSWRTSPECVSGGCLAFDGTDDYIDCGTGANLNITDAITIGAWVKTSNNADQAICARGLNGAADHTWDFITSASGYPLFYWANGYSFGATDYVLGTIAVNDNKWHHLVAEATGLKINIYIDGVLNNSVSKTTKPNSNTNIKVTLGHILGYSTLWFSGSIDDVRIYNAAIPTSQIQQNYYSGLNRLLTSQGILNAEYAERIAQFKNNLAKK
jgi:prepilin-type N-terminal cleavage/methylation domain-containing protein